MGPFLNDVRLLLNVLLQQNAALLGKSSYTNWDFNRHYKKLACIIGKCSVRGWLHCSLPAAANEITRELDFLAISGCSCNVESFTALS